MINSVRAGIPALVSFLALSTAVAVAQAAATPTPSPSPSAPAAAASGASDPCLSMSDLVSRPTFSTSACVVKPHALLVETGYSNTATSGSSASTLVSFPQTNLRVGVANDVEFDLIPPSILRLSGASRANGDSDGSIGAKLQLGQTSKVIYGVNVAYTLQNGSAPFSGNGDGILANLNGNLTLSPALGVFASLGYNEQSAGTPSAPARYHDVQPSLGLSVSLPQSFAVFAEGFNQSSTAPGTGGSFGFDTGIQKDIATRLQLDAEYTDFLTIHSGVHSHAIGVGAAYLFGP